LTDLFAAATHWPSNFCFNELDLLLWNEIGSVLHTFLKGHRGANELFFCVKFHNAFVAPSGFLPRGTLGGTLGVPGCIQGQRIFVEKVRNEFVMMEAFSI